MPRVKDSAWALATSRSAPGISAQNSSPPKRAISAFGGKFACAQRPAVQSHDPLLVPKSSLIDLKRSRSSISRLPGADARLAAASVKPRRLNSPVRVSRDECSQVVIEFVEDDDHHPDLATTIGPIQPAE